MLWIPVNRSLETSLIRQVYNQLRARILHGELRVGERLPSTRALAADLHVSRNVILEAYDQLLAEGYIESRQGSGTYVADGTYLKETLLEQPSPFHASTGSEEQQSISIDFRPGIPALDLFPRKRWAHLAHQVYSSAPVAIFGYDHPEGRVELRTALARYLSRTRGIRCHPDQVIITSGAAQAFSLIAKLLISPGHPIVIEDPMSSEVQAIFSSPGASLYPIPVDEHGMQTDLLPGYTKPGLVYVSPSHQFPLGGILAIQRRIQLIQYARTTGCHIVEDDYDSEFRFSGTPVSSLWELDPERVMYVGTFSKILSPALRLGYMVLPFPLVQLCRRIKRLTDLHSPSPDQLILAHFIEDRYLERHIVKMKRVYHQRRETLIHGLQLHFSGQLTIHGDATGLHLMAAFQGIEFTGQLVDHLKNAGVRIYPVEDHAIRKGSHRNKIVLGYGNLTTQDIDEGTRRMKKALRRL